MASQHQALLETLSQWSKLDTSNSDDNGKALQQSNDTKRIYAISTAKRGKAQQLPTSILLPV